MLSTGSLFLLLVIYTAILLYGMLGKVLLDHRRNIPKVPVPKDISGGEHSKRHLPNNTVYKKTHPG
jgi:hypothetical protein